MKEQILALKDRDKFIYNKGDEHSWEIYRQGNTLQLWEVDNLNNETYLIDSFFMDDHGVDELIKILT